MQIVAIKENGDNALATVIIKNTTDKYVQDFVITWIAFRPVNCAASGPAPRIQQMTIVAESAYAEDRGPNPRPLPPGYAWPSRVLKPHEQTETTSLSLARPAATTAQENNACRLSLLSLLISKARRNLSWV